MDVKNVQLKIKKRFTDLMSSISTSGCFKHEGYYFGFVIFRGPSTTGPKEGLQVLQFKEIYINPYLERLTNYRNQTLRVMSIAFTKKSMDQRNSKFSSQS